MAALPEFCPECGHEITQVTFYCKVCGFDLDRYDPYEE